MSGMNGTPSQLLQKLERGLEQGIPQSLQGNQPSPGSQISGLQACKRINLLFCQATWLVVICYGSHRKLTSPVSTSVILREKSYDLKEFCSFHLNFKRTRADHGAV